MNLRVALTGVLVGLALGGCAVGPNYHRPPVDSPTAFRDDQNPSTNSIGDLGWWQIYQDETLQGLVREAFTNNYDLRVAVARVEQAQAVAAQARAQFVPSVNYNGAVSRGRNDLFGSAYPANGTVYSSAVTTLNAFWEVDLWGRVRRLNESARAQFFASEEARRGVRLSLLSDVASDYFSLQELDQELEIARNATNSFGESLKIFTQRLNGGTASDLETSRAEAALADAASSIPSIEDQSSETENEISLLLGRVPGAIARGSNMMALTPEVPAGLPSSLLERRPDVREAEQELRSANALIGESVAEFFPTIGLTGFLGKVSPEVSAFTMGGANAWGVAAQASGPIFQGGRLVGQYHQAKAARDAARLTYQQTTLTALRDVSDALVRRERLDEIREQQAREVAALARAVETSTKRYLAGKASYYEVLEAQQQLFPAQLSLARTERDQRLVVVALYKALGGGWNEPEKTSPRS